MSPTLGAAFTEIHRALGNQEDALALLQGITQQSLFTPKTHPDQRISATAYHTLLAWVEKRKKGIPIAYILGHQPFWKHSFETTPDTLIPRGETELLIEAIGITLPENHSLIDMGCGSGAIAISLALENRWTCFASELSKSALRVAQKNAKRLDANLSGWFQGSWFEPLKGKRFDAIVSNPPYLADQDPHLNLGDLRFEPPLALQGGRDGYRDLRHIIAHASQHLNPNGWLFLEHGFDQGPWVIATLKAHGFTEISQHRDYQNHPRITHARSSSDNA